MIVLRVLTTICLVVMAIVLTVGANKNRDVVSFYSYAFIELVFILSVVCIWVK